MNGVTYVPQPTFTLINVIKSIAYSWFMWKFSNVMAIFDMMVNLPAWRKAVGFLSFFILLCGADSALFILLNSYSFEGIFVAATIVLALLITSLVHIKT